MLAQYAPIFDAVEKAYGVDRYIIAAIWGIESNYGAKAATVRCCARPRRSPASAAASNYFRDEFLAALEILQRGDITPER